MLINNNINISSTWIVLTICINVASPEQTSFELVQRIAVSDTMFAAIIFARASATTAAPSDNRCFYQGYAI